MTVKALSDTYSRSHSSIIPRLNTAFAVALLVACCGLYLALRPVMPDHTHSHPHSHGPNHNHDHVHDYSQAHLSGGNPEGDTWDGEKYTEFPGLYVSPAPSLTKKGERLAEQKTRDRPGERNGRTIRLVSVHP